MPERRIAPLFPVTIPFGRNGSKRKKSPEPPKNAPESVFSRGGQICCTGFAARGRWDAYLPTMKTAVRPQDRQEAPGHMHGWGEAVRGDNPVRQEERKDASFSGFSGMRFALSGSNLPHFFDFHLKFTLVMYILCE
jgi:hypothetical protein